MGELLASPELQEGGARGCPIPVDRALIFFLTMNYSWIEEIKMAEGTAIFLLFGLKVVLDPTDNF